MNNNQRYSIASIAFSVLAIALFSFSDYKFLGIDSVDLFLVLIALAFISSFIAVMKDRKSILSWILLVVNSIIVMCIVIFLSSFRMKM